jgi:hypothetical protein
MAPTHVSYSPDVCTPRTVLLSRQDDELQALDTGKLGLQMFAHPFGGPLVDRRRRPGLN